jgi:hypothetical protein
VSEKAFHKGSPVKLHAPAYTTKNGLNRFLRDRLREGSLHHDIFFCGRVEGVFVTLQEVTCPRAVEGHFRLCFGKAHGFRIGGFEQAKHAPTIP